MNNSLDVIIIGGGIGGLATALSLHDIGLKPRIYEQSKEIRPLGVGINLLPHAVRELSELGLLNKLRSTGVETDELRFYTQYGLEIQREPRGKRAGYNWPQFSIHRGELQMLLYEAVIERLGHKCIKTNHTALDLTQINNNINVSFIDSATKKNLGTEKADIVIAADGIHSTIRSKFYPNEGKPIYAGINLWRGTTWQKPFLSGQTMILAGTLKTGKMVIYPISQPNQEGKTLVNWVAEVRTASYKNNDWSRRGQIEDFAYRYSDWNFNWLDVLECDDRNVWFCSVFRDACHI